MADILIVDDNDSVRRLVKRRLEIAGHSVREAESARRGLRLMRERRPQLLILDWVLGPSTQGVGICERLKKSAATRAIPIIILTGAKTSFEDELKALESGADLFLTKDVIHGGPEGPSRLIPYVQSLLTRRCDAESRRGWVRAVPGLALDFRRHTVKTPHGIVKNLSTKEFEVLSILASAYPGVVSRSQLVEMLWDNRVRDRQTDVMISRIRAKLRPSGAGPRVIEAVVGLGYRLCAS